MKRTRKNAPAVRKRRAAVQLNMFPEVQVNKTTALDMKLAQFNLIQNIVTKDASIKNYFLYKGVVYEHRGGDEFDNVYGYNTSRLSNNETITINKNKTIKLSKQEPLIQAYDFIIKHRDVLQKFDRRNLAIRDLEIVLYKIENIIKTEFNN